MSVCVHVQYMMYSLKLSLRAYNFCFSSVHSVALEKVFQTMCLD